MAITATIQDNKILLPELVMRSAGLTNGTRIAFRIEGTRIVIENASRAAITELQNIMLGAAEEAGFKDEQELQDYMLGIRKEIRGY